MFRKITLFVLFTLLLTPAAFADPDLPGAAANLETIPVGSLIIPMDTAHQIVGTDGLNDEPENFNIAAYGLANKMLQNNIPLKWAIRSTKVKINGVATAGSNATTLNDTTKNFVTLGVQIGDLVTNVDSNPMARKRVTAVAATSLTLANIDATAFAAGNDYVIDGYDFTATAERIRPGVLVAAAPTTFTSGPFIVSSENPAALAKALEIILGTSDGIPPLLPQFNVDAAQQSVRVYRTTTVTNNVDVRYNLKHKPFVLVSNVNTHIHADILIEAGIPGAAGAVGAKDNQYTNCTPTPGNPAFNPNACNWNQINPLDLSLFECATLHTEPHRNQPNVTATIALINTAVQNFLTGGGNSTWQCHSIEYLENLNLGTAVPPGKFMTSLGIDSVNTATPQAYPNSPVPFSQMTGPLDGGQGGSVTGWDLNGGTYDKNNAYIVSQNAASALIHKAAGAKLPTGGGIGGNLFYLGGHEYKDAGELEQINGRRMLLNTLFVPADRDPNCGLTINATLTLQKRVVNDDGGVAGIDDFTIGTNAGLLNWDAGVDDGPNTKLYKADPISVLALIAYALSDGEFPGYIRSAWSCTGGDGLGGGDPDTASVTLNPGDSKVCTITNNDVASNPAIEIDKEGTLDVGADLTATPGDLITYAFSVTNLGDVELTSVAVTDPLPGLSAIDCSPEANPIASIPVGASPIICTATYPITQADIDAGLRDNTATATGQCTVPIECPVADDDPETVDITQAPLVEIVKTGALDVGDDATATIGDIITYTFDVTNTGNVTLYDLLVTDPLTGLSAITCPGGNPIPTLAPGASVLGCTATYAILQADIIEGQVQNLATVTAYCEDQDVTTTASCATDTDPHVEPIGQQPRLTLIKTGDGPDDAYDAVGDTLTYDFTVTNTGNVPLANPVTIDDDLTTDESCPSTITVGNLDGFLDPGESIDCTASYVVVQGDLDNGEVNNCATASADGTESNEDCETLEAEQLPDIEIDKEGTFDQGADTTSTVGDIISYTFDVTNTGNITLWNVTVTDPLITDPPNSGTITCPSGNPIPTLAPLATEQCTATYAITQADLDAAERQNLATVNGDCTDDAQEPCTTDEDPNTEEIPTSPDINLAKTLNGPATLEANGTYTVVYTITATNNGNASGTYDLVDTFSPGSGITLGTASAVYLAGTENSQTGTTGAYPNFVTGEPLAAGLNESWTVTANFTVNPAQVSPNDSACDPGEPGINTGFYNAVSGVVDETDLTDNDTCTGLPDPNINLAKTLNGPATLEANGTYTVVYTITATNNGTGPGFYDLVDTFSPGSGIALNTATAVYVAGTEDSQTGTTGAYPNFVTGEALAGSRDESWTVTANFTVTPANVSPDNSQCDPAEPTISTGFYNAVSGVVDEEDTSDNDTCTGLPDPNINLAKTVSSPAVQQPDSSYTVVYTITATNNGTGPGFYDLVDTFSPAVGITLNTATAVYVAGTENSQTGTTGAYPNFVTNEALAGSRNETWTVTANFTVTPAELDEEDSFCDPTDPVENTGFYNEVSGVDSETDTTDNDTCTPLQIVTLEATPSCVNDVPWVNYSVTAFGFNPAPTSLTYTWINRELEPDVIVSGPTVTTDFTADILWPGTTADGAAPGANGLTWPGWTESPPGTWTFDSTTNLVPKLALVVEVNPTDELVLEYPPLSPFCNPLPPAVLTVNKEVMQVQSAGTDLYNVTFRMTATNTGGQSGTYDLFDQLFVDESLTPVTVVTALHHVPGTEAVTDGTLIAATAAQYAAGATILTGESLAAGSNEHWEVTIQFQLDPATVTEESADCTVDGEGDNTGFTNHVELLVDEVVVDEDDACAPVPLPIEKTQFRVVKDFTDDNPAHVEVEISCFTGLPLIQTQEIWEGRDVVFIVEAFDPGELDCDISEVIPEGYSPTYDGSIISGASDVPTEDGSGCHFDNVVSGEFLCEIVNTPDPVDVVIEKIWVIEGSVSDIVDTRYKLKLFCDAEIVDGTTYCGNQYSAPTGYEGSETWCKTFYGDDSAIFTAHVIPEYPDSHCWVEETVYDDSVEVDNDCENLVVSAGHGASCVITNTVFFEGIPTLSQYGVAILALLMLGVGLVGFRRFS